METLKEKKSIKKLLTTQNRHRKFKQMSFECLTLSFGIRQPKNEVERIFLQQLDNILKELGLKGEVNYSLMKGYNPELRKIVYVARAYTVIINGKTNYFYTNFFQRFSTTEMLSPSFNIRMKYTIVYSLFGDNYNGNLFIKDSDELLQYKILYLRERQKLFFTTSELNKYKEQVLKVVPLQGIREKTKLSNFFKLKKIK